MSDPVSSPRALIIAAGHTGAGKTSTTIGLARAFRTMGLKVATAKAGPDYLDPKLHRFVTGRAAVTLDPWSMPAPELRALLADQAAGVDLVLIEGVMGLFDGGLLSGCNGIGATSDLAKALNLPVLIVLDASRMGQSLAAIAHGLQSFDPELDCAGFVLNKVASERHRQLLEDSFTHARLRLSGCIPNRADITLPHRHLGLVQPEEQAGLHAVIDRLADHLARHLDLEAILAAAAPVTTKPDDALSTPLPPLGQHIAIARDSAFSFAYTHILDGWRKAGAEASFFSPLADEPPGRAADAVFLCGGYPELYAGQLAAASRFQNGLRQMASQGKVIYGECGGYMVMGKALIDEQGASHEMPGLLDHVASFQTRKLALGYRLLQLVADGPLGHRGAQFRGHEFHYATLTSTPDSSGPSDDSGLFRDRITGQVMGQQKGAVCGSFGHIIYSQQL